MNITQLSEQLKDVPQNRLIDYAKNPNSVVPQFLALAEIQRRQQLSAQAQPPQSTVANDVLAQAAPQAQPVPMAAPMMQPQQMAQQLPENQPGVAQLPSRVAPQGFANGGIVAFASGDLVDDDEEDREMSRLFPTGKMGNLMDMISSIPSGVRALADKLPQSYVAAKAAREQEAVTTRRGSHKYEDAVIEEAKRQGVDPNLALHVLYKETGNIKDPETARSKAGALGVMQLMPKTAAGLGVDPMNPMENIRGGVTYLKQMADKYKENRLAAAAYNTGPGNLDKALRRPGGLDTLAGETRNYIAGLAKGGDVKHFVEGGIDTLGAELDALRSGTSTLEQASTAGGSRRPAPQELMDAYTNAKLLRDAKEREYLAALSKAGVDKPAFMPQYSMQANRPVPNPVVQAQSARPAPAVVPVAAPVAPAAAAPAVAASAVPTAGTSQQDFRDFDQAAALFQAENANKLAAREVPERMSATDLDREELRDAIKSQAESLAKQGKIDQALAVMQAGFGIMKSAGTIKAGERSTFLGNIAGGAEQGINTLAALGKQRADQAKDLLGARLGLYKYGAAEEGAKEYREYNKLFREAEAERKGVEFNQKQIAFARDDLRQYEQMRIKQIENAYKNKDFDPKQKAAYDAAVASVYNEPQYKALFKLGYPNIEMPTQSSVPATGGWSIKPKQ